MNAGHRKEPPVKPPLAVTVALVLTAVAAPAAAAKVTTIRVNAITTSQQTVVDNPPASTADQPFSAGDILVFTNKLLPRGKRVGSHRGVCAATDSRRLVCTAVSELPGGDVSIVGLFDTGSTKPQQLAIVGGTRRYRSARGELQATLSETKEAFVYRIET